jgi:hypothetical protein
MIKIALHDYENARVIVAEIPTYLTDKGASDEEIAQAIMEALGISSSNTEYMIGDFNFQVDVACLNEGGYGNRARRLDEFTQDFKGDVLAALEITRQ